MSRNNYDALIDQLLREILGNDRPRDITERVLAQAKIQDRFRRRVWVSAGAAIAACIAIAAGLTVFWPREYPGTRVTDGQIYASTPGEPQRGTTLETDDENEGTFNIGDYVNVTMAPQTALTLGGAKYQEKVILDRGHVDVQVTKNRGKFDVAVGQALVHVTGTRFGLDVQDGLDETQTKRVKTLFVDVQEGSVDVQGIKEHKTLTLKGGERESFVISSEPVPVIKRSSVPAATTAPDATSPNPVRARPGIAAGMQEGARIGNRGVIRPQVEANTARGGLLAGQNRVQATQVANLLRSVQIYSGTEAFERTGMLRQVGGFDVLETSQGTYLLFPHATPTLKEFRPITDRPVRVNWKDGAIKSIEPVTSSTAPTTSAASKPI